MITTQRIFDFMRWFDNSAGCQASVYTDKEMLKFYNRFNFESMVKEWQEKGFQDPTNKDKFIMNTHLTSKQIDHLRKANIKFRTYQENYKYIVIIIDWQ